MFIVAKLWAFIVQCSSCFAEPSTLFLILTSVSAIQIFEKLKYKLAFNEGLPSALFIKFGKQLLSIVAIEPCLPLGPTRLKPVPVC